MRNLLDSPLDNRWRLDDLNRLVVEDNGAIGIGGDGNLFWLQKLPDGSYLPPEGQLRGISLVANGNGTFTMTDQHGGQSQFDQYGLLTSRVDRVGNTMAFSYIDLDSDGVPDSLSQMVDAAGRTTTFNYVDGRFERHHRFRRVFDRKTGQFWTTAFRNAAKSGQDAASRTRPLRCTWSSIDSIPSTKSPGTSSNRASRTVMMSC